ncbi:MAG: glycine cleavage system aminomethyltransferase GcvT [Candidatus Brocadiales bacterium]|nr:glycine cleavage system aminomethyltransferase GcvT [Candidatus Bathyanammoxibius amoris]
MPKQTPLYSVHKALGASLTEFHGFLLPLEYTTITEEHMAVRNRAGIFDLSHMGEIEISGGAALEFIQGIIANDAEGLSDGKALYTPICNERGGIVDDVMLYRFSAERFVLVVNAGNIQKMFDWLVGNQTKNVTINDLSDGLGMIAVQGPASASIIEEALGRDEANIRRFHFLVNEQAAADPVTVSRTGYTGEDGFEMYVPVAQCETIWNRIMGAGTKKGLQPAGLGARDTLRVEAGLLLYGNDIDDHTTPLEAGIDWTVKFDKGDFIGRAALLDQKASGIRMRLVGLELVERGIPRAGCRIFAGSNIVGKVTSGTHSPFFKKGIAMGYVYAEERCSNVGSLVHVDVRGTRLAARIIKLPFYRVKYHGKHFN